MTYKCFGLQWLNASSQTCLGLSISNLALLAVLRVTEVCLVIPGAFLEGVCDYSVQYNLHCRDSISFMCFTASSGISCSHIEDSEVCGFVANNQA